MKVAQKAKAVAKPLPQPPLRFQAHFALRHSLLGGSQPSGSLAF